MTERLYLDHAATTPVVPAARAAIADALDLWANPSSPHGEGRAARAALEAARARIADALGWDGEIILTSGASEALAMALSRAKTTRILVGATEHDAVLRAAPDAPRIPVGRNGRIFPAALESALAEAEGPALVAIQSANNETGVLQDVAAIRALVREAGGLLLVDASQSAGKLPLVAADFIAVSAHKLGGPPGIGALLVRDLASLHALGGQEKGYRPGTENLPAALGLAAALEAPKGWLDRAAELRHHCDKAIEKEGGSVVARDADRIATIAGYRMPGMAATAQLIQFDMAGIAISAGSACASGSLKSSHVLAAMGWNEAEASEVIRVSFGPQTKRADIYRFIESWTRFAAEARERAA